MRSAVFSSVTAVAVSPESKRDLATRPMHAPLHDRLAGSRARRRTDQRFSESSLRARRRLRHGQELERLEFRSRDCARREAPASSCASASGGLTGPQQVSRLAIPGCQS